MNHTFTADPEIEVAHAVDVSTLGPLRSPAYARGTRENHRALVRASGIVASSPECNPHINWSEIRPMTLHFTPDELMARCRTAAAGEIVLAWDCAAYVTWLCKSAGMRDPNGLGFDGLGDTEIMLANPEIKPHYTENEKAWCGAIGIYYGGNLPQHAIQHGDEPGVKDPLVNSMGSDKGPLLIPKSWEDTAHPGQDFVWCTVGRLIPRA